MQERQKITAEEFVKSITIEFNKGNTRPILNGLEVSDKVSVALSSIDASHILINAIVIIKNCVFLDEIEIAGELQNNNKTYIEISESVFSKELKISRSRSEIKIKNAVFYKLLHFDNIVSQVISINDISDFFSILFSNCECELILINRIKSNIKDGQIEFVKNKIRTYRLLSVKCSNISFNTNNFNSILDSSSLRLKTLRFINNDFENINLNNFIITKQLLFHKTTLKQNININIDNVENDERLVNLGELSSIKITKSSFSDFILKGSHRVIVNKELFEGNSIDVDVEFDSSTSGNFVLENLNLNVFKISGNNENANITILNCEVINLCVSNFINKKWFYITDLSFNSKSKIDINKSYLGHTLLTNIDFRTVITFSIIQSQLSGLIANNIFWPNSIKTINYTDKRSIFRQLKSAMLSQNEKVQALEFESQEMAAYQMEIKNNGQWQDKFILWASSTNDFGQNWWKALKYLFRAALALHILAILFINWGLSDMYFIEILDKIEALVYYFNPIHTTKDLWAVYNSSSYPDYDVIADWFYFFDFAARLVTGFFYFQIVRAFRKYAR